MSLLRIALFSVITQRVVAIYFRDKLSDPFSGFKN